MGFLDVCSRCPLSGPLTRSCFRACRPVARIPPVPFLAPAAVVGARVLPEWVTRYETFCVPPKTQHNKLHPVWLLSW